MVETTLRHATAVLNVRSFIIRFCFLSVKLRKLPDKGLASALWSWCSKSSLAASKMLQKRGTLAHYSPTLLPENWAINPPGWKIQGGQLRCSEDVADPAPATERHGDTRTLLRAWQCGKGRPPLGNAWKMSGLRSLENSATTYHHSITAEGLLWWFDLYQGWGSGWLWAQPRPQNKFERE